MITYLLKEITCDSSIKETEYKLRTRWSKQEFFSFPPAKKCIINSKFIYANQSQTDELNKKEKVHALAKHLSKSASELDTRENYSIPSSAQSSSSPQRRTVAGVLQRTHGFLNTLKVDLEQKKNLHCVLSFDGFATRKNSIAMSND